jgi:hypothetical protein
MKNFGRNPILSFGSMVLAALWLLTAAAQAATPGAAQVKKVVGNATYTDARGGGVIKEGDILMQGATITTGAGSYVDLDMGVNGNALRVEADSTLSLNKLDYTKAGETIVNTQVEVKKGAVVSNVITKLSKASKYEIKTPAGVAGIRGTVTRATVTRVTCLIGTISFVPLQGGGVAIVINGGNAFSAGSLAAVRAGAAESSSLARSATSLTANTSPAAVVANTVQQFTAALALDAASDAAKAGGDTAKAAADTAKAATADLLQALQQAAADASPQVKAAIQAMAATLTQASESNTAKAAAQAAGIAVKLNGGSDAQAQTAASSAAGQTTSNPQVAQQAVLVAGPSIRAAEPGVTPPLGGPGTGGPQRPPPVVVVVPPTTFVSPTAAGNNNNSTPTQP